jgi:hypothetical protein
MLIPVYIWNIAFGSYRKEKQDPLPAAHSLHMVLNAVLLNYGTPLVDFQV